jgi:predicted nucleotidyltransferase
LALPLNNIKAALSEYPVEFAYLYGSYATGTNRKFSDLDIALLVEDRVPPEKYWDIESKISLKIDALLKEVESDVRIFNLAPLNYRAQIVKEGKLIYSKNEIKRVDFESATRDEYFDFLPMRKEYQATLLNGIKKEGLAWSIRKK